MRWAPFVGLLAACVALGAPALADSDPEFPFTWYARSEPAPLGKFQPIVVADVDYWIDSAPNFAEGTNGFSIGRLNLGAQMAFTNWLLAVASINPVAKEGTPIVLDTFVSLRPYGSWELNIGAAKTPLFSSARDEFAFELPIPELPMVVRTFWPGRDVGVEIHRMPTSAIPLEGWLRFGNGTGSALGNDNDDFAVDARLDVALGRARQGTPIATRFGLRVGAGVHAKSAEDHLGITGTTADNFAFFRPVTVAGPQRIGEVHIVGFAGPLKLDAAAAYASEGRLSGGSGDPDVQRPALDPAISTGEYVEVAWMITGQHRVLGAHPIRDPLPASISAWNFGGVEVAARVERLDLEKDARGVTPGGATAGAFAVRWWTTRYLALSAAGYRQRYDAPPLEEPTKRGSWLGLLEASIYGP